MADAASPEIARLALPQVTLCAVTSVNVEATVLALERCLAQIDFGACKLFIDEPISPPHEAIEIVRCPRLRSSADYSAYMLRGIAAHIDTTHCLIVQWDGHVLDAQRWRPEFLTFDYVGARWPQFTDGHDVGNGGFSLRSRRLMSLCADRRFIIGDAEDVAICRTNRAWLEQQGMRFAPAPLADAFSAERAGDLRSTFGYHGVFNMPRALGASAFSDVLRQLDDRATVWHDIWRIAADLVWLPRGLAVAARLVWLWLVRRQP